MELRAGREKEKSGAIDLDHRSVGRADGETELEENRRRRPANGN